MREILRSAFALASLSTICSAQTITETFGAGDNVFSIDFVEIGNPGVSSVEYAYHLGKYEISRAMIYAANADGELQITMTDTWLYQGNNKPAAGISWHEAAKFVNYLNTSTGYMSAYNFDGLGNFQLWSPSDSGYNSNNPFRNNLAKYVLPSSAEWNKGAYGDPSGGWHAYPTGDTLPYPVDSGTASNTAVYFSNYGPANINQAGGLSQYGTMAQGGNVWELTETASDLFNDSELEVHQLHGGGWFDPGFQFGFGLREGEWIGSDYRDNSGFRVAMVPEPSSLSLLALGGVVVALGRRRR